MEQSPRLTLSYVMPQQAQKHVTVNETFRRLDALVQMSVRSRIIIAEPGAPVEGDAYILPAGATGASWDNYAAASVAAFQDGAWVEIPAMEGHRAYVADESTLVVYDGAAWAAVSGGGGGGGETSPRFGVNAAADNTNRLSVKSDAILFSHDDVTPGNDHCRVKVNKSAPADTASLLFQTGFSGRAEFGLTGDDDFRLKVSDDGASFTDAAIFDRISGAASFPAGVATLASENLIANGGFDIWQRGVSFLAITTAQYTADRWYVETQATSTDVSRETLATGDLGEQHTTYCMRIQMNTSAANAGIDRREEAPPRFMGGKITYSFWARADIARSFDVEFRIIFGAGGSADEIIAAGSVSVTTGWQKFAVTADVPATTGFTFGADPRFEARLRHAASAAWRLDLAQAKIERGPVATPFTARDPGRDMADCLRYFFKLEVAAGSGYASAAGQTQRAQTSATFPAPMRAAPVMTAANMSYTGANIDTAAGLLTFNIRSTAIVFSMKSSAGGSVYWKASGDIMLDAEI